MFIRRLEEDNISAFGQFKDSHGLDTFIPVFVCSS